MATITPALTSKKASRPRSGPAATPELGRARVVIIGGGTAGISSVTASRRNASDTSSKCNPDRKEAAFAVVGDPNGARETIRYDMMHAGA